MFVEIDGGNGLQVFTGYAAFETAVPICLCCNSEMFIPRSRADATLIYNHASKMDTGAAFVGLYTGAYDDDLNGV